MNNESRNEPPVSTSAEPLNPSRREFLAWSGKIAAGSALAGVAIPWVHAQVDHSVRLALIGCGGRGSGAISDAFHSTGGPVQLVAMADLFENRLTSSHTQLNGRFADQVDVPEDRRFLGFDAYKKAMDCLRPGDIAVLTTHAAFRAAHFQYAIERGLNVFMEKSFAPDPGGVKRILQIGAAADEKGLKVGTGLMCRHSSARQEMIQKIRDGEMGEIQLIRAYRMDAGDRLGPWKGGENELLWQIRRPYFFYWVSTGRFIDYMIHQVDECCWIKDAWPVSAHGLGGRIPGSTDCGQNFDTYSIEYTYADGTKALVNGRFVPQSHNDFATFVHGTKCAGQFSGSGHAPTVQIYKDQRVANNNIAWRPREAVSPYQAEWNVLLDAIRNNKPHNEARRSAYTNLAAIMGRAAVHTGQIITWDQAMASDYQFCRNVDGLTSSSPAPVQADEQGRYPAPAPGSWTEI
jgi:predicted dehydrogenase